MTEKPADPAAPAEAPPKSSGRVFLVVVDESPELGVALRYACVRAKKTGGRVALLYVIEPADFQQWAGVNELMREEARQEAEQALQKMAADVQKLSAAMPVLYVREGERRDELLKLIDEEPTISILVLGAATGPRGPGPLVSALTSKFVGKLRVPVTIVPGNLSLEDVDNVA
jgi:nucleotide-binding universal stress UspA family protein